jgi:hypothetical protein
MSAKKPGFELVIPSKDPDTLLFPEMYNEGIKEFYQSGYKPIRDFIFCCFNLKVLNNEKEFTLQVSDIFLHDCYVAF